jgi:exodeoxyribonuclease VII large subunit
MEIPVISAVGHETDFTICDFVADLRAPTPSAAAELAVPNIEELLASAEGFALAMKAAVKSKISQSERMLTTIKTSGVFAAPVSSVCDKRALMLDSISERIKSRTEKLMLSKESDFAALASNLEALSPIKTMLRGFSVAIKDGKNVNSVEQLVCGDSINLRLSDGSAECDIKSINKEQKNG